MRVVSRLGRSWHERCCSSGSMHLETPSRSNVRPTRVVGFVVLGLALSFGALVVFVIAATLFSGELFVSGY